LAHGDAVLRGSRLAEGLYHTGKVLDRNLKRRFNYYLRETSRRLVQINQVIEGRNPVWHAEPPLPHLAHDRVRSHNQDVLANFAASHFQCDPVKARRAIMLLAHGDALLRGSRLAEGLYHSGKVLDRNLKRRFNYYLRETSRRLVQINRVIEGRYPVWHPEPPMPHLAYDHVRSHTLRQINYHLPIPLDLFLEADCLEKSV